MLRLGDFNLFRRNIFVQEQNVSPIQKRAESIIVALDGSGDTDDIGEAVKMLPADGGQIFIKAGNYYPKAQIDIDKNGVSIEGVGRTTKIYGSFLPDESAIFWVSGNDFCIEKCFLDMTCTAGAVSGIYGDSTERNFVSNCWFQNGTGTAIIYDGDKNIITSNIITATNDGIVISFSHNNLVLGNVVYSCSNDGIYVYQGDRNIVSNNRCYSNGSKGINIAGEFADRNLVIGNICNLNVADQIADTGTNTLEASNVEA